MTNAVEQSGGLLRAPFDSRHRQRRLSLEAGEPRTTPAQTSIPLVRFRGAPLRPPIVMIH